MATRKAALHLVALAAGALGAHPAVAQPCPQLSTTGHVEFIGSVPGVNLGRHIVYSYAAVQTGDVHDDGTCVVEGQLEHFLYEADPGGDLTRRGDLVRRSHGEVVCLGVGPDLSTPRPGEPPRPTPADPDAGEPVAHVAALITYYEGEPPPPTIDTTQPVYWIWKVQDNGEGGNAPFPDYSSSVAVAQPKDAFGQFVPPYAYCQRGNAQNMGPLFHGNVQVRPSE
jgi:hypothetical protein